MEIFALSLAAVSLLALAAFFIVRGRAVSRLESRAAELSAMLAAERSQNELLCRSNGELKAEKSALDASKLALERSLAAAEERISALTERMKNRSEEEKAVRDKFAADFENLSNRIFEAARDKMASSNAENMGLILAPLKNSLREFRERVEHLNAVSIRNNASMETQIESLVKMGVQLGDDARNLTAALRSNNKVAGNWGETVLQRIFESCGFMEGVHFRSQKSYADSEGGQKRLVPDFVVYLPDSRSIVVDSKLSLLDFADYCSAQDGVSKRSALAKFKKSVREHLRDFSKKYNDLPDVSCGFKLMFMPVEGAYNLIVEEDPALLSDAYAENVLIVGPSSVMAVLKFAEIAYRNEAFAKNLKEICNAGRLLNERVELFSRKFESLGIKINSLREDFSNVQKTLSQGNRSVLETAKRFLEKSKAVGDGFENKESDSEDE